MGLNLSEDLFFCSSPYLGQKIGLILGGPISYSDLCFSQIFRSSWPPPFQNPEYATGGNKPTFRTKTREEVLDLTVVNRCACDRVVE